MIHKNRSSRYVYTSSLHEFSVKIIPNSLGRMLNDKDPAKSKRTLNAMLQMEKLDLKRLQRAYDEE